MLGARSVNELWCRELAVTVISIEGKAVRLGVSAPRTVASRVSGQVQGLPGGAPAGSHRSRLRHHGEARAQGGFSWLRQDRQMTLNRLKIWWAL
jgi:hypothetical protein